MNVRRPSVLRENDWMMKYIFRGVLNRRIGVLSGYGYILGNREKMKGKEQILRETKKK